jgi:hypothetical protein
MHVSERVGELRAGRGHIPSVESAAVQACAQRRAVDQLHHQERAVVEGACVQHGDQVRVGQLRQGRGLARKACPIRSIGRHEMQRLDRHRPV